MAVNVAVAVGGGLDVGTISHAAEPRASVHSIDIAAAVSLGDLIWHPLSGASYR
jgi:hypothetical protein